MVHDGQMDGWREKVTHRSGCRALPKKNITASTSFKCILLYRFCIIFITHVYKNILRKHEK